MRLAARAGLDVAPVRLEHVSGRDVLLVERFDRSRTKDGWTRKAMVSALTLFGLDEMMARYASYEDLAEIIRHRFTSPRATLHELFGRLAFNILCGNTDDHARNHAGFWDGEYLTLTPAYDICPQRRSGNLASQAMLIVGDNRTSTLATCLEAARNFQFSQKAAKDIIDWQIGAIRGRMGRNLRGSRIDRSRPQPVRPAHLSERVYLRRHGGGATVMENRDPVSIRVRRLRWTRRRSGRAGSAPGRSAASMTLWCGWPGLRHAGKTKRPSTTVASGFSVSSVLSSTVAGLSGEDHEIGQLARSEAALDLLLEREPCGLDSAGSQRRQTIEPLIRPDAPSGDALAPLARHRHGLEEGNGNVVRADRDRDAGLQQ